MSSRITIGSTYFKGGFFNQKKEMTWLQKNEDNSNISIAIQCRGPNSEVTVLAEIRYKGGNGEGEWINASHNGRIFATPKRPLVEWFKKNISKGDILYFSRIDDGEYSLALEPSLTSPVISDSTDTLTSDNEEWDKTDDWFWEGNVQNNIVDYLKSQRYSDIRTVDTKSKEQGPDISANKDGKPWIIEVKGYPSDKYVETTSQHKKGDPKPTRPATQARHWFSGALLEALLSKSEKPNLEIGLGFPNYGTYIKFLNRLSYFRGKLDIHAFIVENNGQVKQYHPYQQIPS